MYKKVDTKKMLSRQGFVQMLARNVIHKKYIGKVMWSYQKTFVTKVLQ